MYKSLLVIVFTGAATNALAEDRSMRIGLGVSTMGATLEAAHRFNKSWAVRGVLSGGINAKSTHNIDGVNYDTVGKLGGLSVLGDFYTGNSGFRISGGMFFSNTSLTGTVTASPTNPVPIGNQTLTGGETANVSVEFKRKFSPIFTIGYDKSIGRNFLLSTEVGGIFTDGFAVKLESNQSLSADVQREIINIDNEFSDKVNNKLSKLGVYPYVAFTLSYHF